MQRETGGEGLIIVLGWKDIAVTLIAGVSIALALGLVENTPEFYIGLNKLYGYPLPWRNVPRLLPPYYNIVFLLLDILLWTAVTFMVVALFEGANRKSREQTGEGIEQT